MSTQKPLVSLSQETKSQESLKSFTKMHCRMEVRKNPRNYEPLVSLREKIKETTHPQNLHFYNQERKFASWVSNIDESDMGSPWHSRRCFMGTDEGRTSPPGFSNV